MSERIAYGQRPLYGQTDLSYGGAGGIQFDICITFGITINKYLYSIIYFV